MPVTQPEAMNSNSRRLSRRTFVENAAIAMGVLGPVAAASTYGAEQSSSPSATPGNQVNARQPGAKGDGSTDDTKALQAALEAAKANGPICYLPPGLYRLNGALTVPAGVTLCGASGGVPHSEHPIGTVLLAFGGRGQPEGEPLITLKPNAVVRNLIIHYPEQTLPEVVALSLVHPRGWRVVPNPGRDPDQSLPGHRRGHQMERTAPGPERLRLPVEDRRLHRPMHRHRPHRERPFQSQLLDPHGLEARLSRAATSRPTWRRTWSASKSARPIGNSSATAS